MTARRFDHLIHLGLLILILLSGGCTGLRLVAPPQSPPDDQSPEPPAGLVIQGHVRVNPEGGPGLAGVRIYRGYASYPGVVVATTDQDGHYQSDFASIPGDEMVTVRAELEGYTFEPEQYSWRHYCGHESRTLNFVAVSVQ